MTIYTRLESPLGELVLTSDQNKLTGLYFADQAHAPKVGHDWVRRDNDDLFLAVDRQIYDFATGKREDFDLPTMLHGTPFQLCVWREIQAIPFGQTVCYSELALRVGALSAVRAVGTATGANPISWIIPCHRVIGKNGAVTGYAGGLPRKEALLDFEAGRLAGHHTALTLEKRGSHGHKRSQKLGPFAPKGVLHWGGEPGGRHSQHAA